MSLTVEYVVTDKIGTGHHWIEGFQYTLPYPPQPGNRIVIGDDGQHGEVVFIVESVSWMLSDEGDHQHIEVALYGKDT